MTQRNAKLQTIESNSVTFADPMDVNHTFRMKNGRAQKSISGVQLTNNRIEFIDNDTAAQTDGDKTVKEPLSVRVVISGSIEAKAQLSQMWADTKVNVDAAIADGALNGFKATEQTGIAFGVVVTP